MFIPFFSIQFILVFRISPIQRFSLRHEEITETTGPLFKGASCDTDKTSYNQNGTLEQLDLQPPNQFPAYRAIAGD